MIEIYNIILLIALKKKIQHSHENGSAHRGSMALPTEPVCVFRSFLQANTTHVKPVETVITGNGRRFVYIMRTMLACIYISFQFLRNNFLK